MKMLAVKQNLRLQPPYSVLSLLAGLRKVHLACNKCYASKTDIMEAPTYDLT